MLIGPLLLASCSARVLTAVWVVLMVADPGEEGQVPRVHRKKMRIPRFLKVRWLQGWALGVITL